MLSANTSHSMQSLTIQGLAVIALGQLFSSLGVQIGDSDLTGFINVVSLLGGLLMAYIGRVRLGDITAFGSRKK